jgi:hypothetical protein
MADATPKNWRSAVADEGGYREYLPCGTSALDDSLLVLYHGVICDLQIFGQ